jgi:apolipoprotein N-acyltransferase
VFGAVPDKMVMIYAMVFGAHLLPYSWLYKSINYRIFAIVIPILSLVLGCLYSATAVAIAMIITEILFAVLLFAELRKLQQRT